MGHATSEFSGTERFRIRRRLGSGGMGIVYEALDRRTDQVVALKALTRTEAPHISRFKHEFRSLADVSHPNLVSLYEFMSDGKYWFFTMELVPGVSFLEYVRPGFRTRRKSRDSVTPTLMIEPEPEPEAEAVHFEAETQQLDPERVTAVDESQSENPEVPTVDKSHLDLDRLERALLQLADGLNGLHQTGKLHRDIKPSNVLVTIEGCVKILDFGLVAEVENPTLQENLILAGTPDYMSPEQGAQRPISTASDWYSVGVILYQSLTGRLPFSGQFFEVMMCKQSSDPPPPHELVTDLPRHLSDLCMSLLQRDPSKRPSGSEVIRALGGDGLEAFGQPLTTIRGTGPTRRSTFIGRQSQLEELDRAYAAAKNGETVSVYVPGVSGIGKSALARHFLEELRKRDPKVVILEGRCYERESVPFKAIDGVIDSLTRFLMSLPDAKAESLTPREIHALAKLFPVMLQVDSVFNAPQLETEIPDPINLRRRAFAALRELLAQIREHQPLVIWIDDLQWADPDSIILLEELLRPPGSPTLLLLASFRSEDIESKSFLESLLAGTGTKNCRQLKVTPLNQGEAEALVSSLFRQRPQDVQLIVDSIVPEAGGSPFLLEQLSSYAAASEHSSTTGISLAVMLQARLKQVPTGAREFINTLAVAGRPINQKVAFEAAGLKGDELPLVTALRASQFLRSEGPEQRVELYHDRIRETLASQLDPLTVKRIHRRLAQAIESRGLDDPESLFEHFLGAGERVRAANYAAVAARKAKAKLAFDRAAVFFRRALELAPARGADLLEMKRELADALANAGRPAEAALTYLELANETSESRSLDFKRRAAQQFLMGGHITEGLQILRSLLSAVGFSLPGGPQAALLTLTLNRLKIRLRGLKFEECPESNISGSTLVRIDTCWAVAAGLGMVDLIYGADFQSRHLLLALRAGEPYRVARALALEAVQTAASGVRGRKRALLLAEKAEELAQRVANPHAVGLALWARGLIAYLAGHWRNASELCERAAEVLRDECTGVAWEATIAHRFMLSSLLYCGEVAEVSRRVPHLLLTAVEQGNLFAATDLRTRMNLIWLAADNPTRAREEVIAALKAWPQEGFHLQHFSSMMALAQIELYTGDFEVAWKHLEGHLQPLKQSMLLRIQILRIEARHLRARAALASASGRDREVRLKIAAKLARKIQKEKLQWADPLASLIWAGLAAARRNDSGAKAFLSQALEGFLVANMELYAAATRRRLGLLIGEARGRQLVAQADEWMSKQEIQNPERMMQMLIPGFD